jgi:signal transduction histidine kinase
MSGRTTQRDVAAATKQAPSSRDLHSPDRHRDDLREANEQLLIAALSAQEREAQAERAHSRQIKLQAMVVHELRNPLAPIRIAAELLTRVHKGEPLLADLQVMIERQVVHMTRLIDDLLDGSRVSAGMFRLERSTVDMNDILMLAVEACRPALDARSQQLTMQVSADLPRIDGDPVRLTQIFSNLLDNASKYTPEGGQITLCAQVLDHALVIIVSDNGIGITAEVLPTIFDLFVQDTQALVRRNTGLGIGLAVVRELVEAHAGTVIARSAGRNLGSEFVVTLPLCGGGADCRLSRPERTFQINVLRSPSLPEAADRIPS